MPAWNGKQGALVDVGALLDATTVEWVQELIELGALISFGTSRDGGALSVHVRLGEIKNREWFRDAEELHDWLQDGVAACRQVVAAGPSNVKALRTS